MKGECTFQVFRGDAAGGELKEYVVPVETGMVVLDAIHWIQAHVAPDLACRWNCKAAKCGSCSAEVNGRPKLMCKTRLDEYPQGTEMVVRPMRTFPVIRDLVTNVKSNYAAARKITPFTPKKDAQWKWYQEDIDRVQEFRKCIQCFLCQDVCHVLREHDKHESFAGPAIFRSHRGHGNASHRRRRPDSAAERTARSRPVQHHQVLYRGLSGGYSYNGQRHHPVEGAGG